MRALVRADLLPSDYWEDLWTTNVIEYDKEVVQLFTDLGFGPVKVGQETLLQDKAVQEIIVDIPDHVREQETSHLVMLGYISEGQAYFIVSSINPTVLHIRVRGRLFGRLARACAELNRNVNTLVKRRSQRFKNVVGDRTVGKAGAMLKLRSEIEVMEPGKEQHTILGHIIDSAAQEVLRQSTNEKWLVLFTFIAAVGLFVLTPSIAPPISRALNALGMHFEVSYIQGALERTYSAFLVTLTVTLVGLGIRIFDVRRQKPIRWTADEAKMGSSRN